jgi:hypothetical protein
VDLVVVVEALLVEQEQPIRDSEEETNLVLEEAIIRTLGAQLAEEVLVVKVQTAALILEEERVELEFRHPLLEHLWLEQEVVVVQVLQMDQVQVRQEEVMVQG